MTPDSRNRVPRLLVGVGCRRPWRVLLTWAAVLAIATPGVMRLRIEASTESVLDKSAVDWAFYQHSLDLFGGDEIAVLAIEVGEAPAIADLEGIRSLSRSLEELEGVRRVDSLSTFPIIDVSRDGALTLSPAIPGDASLSDMDPSEVLEFAASDRIVPNVLASDDTRTLAINLVLEREPAEYYPRILAALRNSVKAESSPFARAWISGVPVFQHETSLQTRHELIAFAPVAAVVIWLLIAFIFRSFAEASVVLAIGGAGNWLMLAAIGASGVPVSFTMVILPPLILALAAAYSMHLLAAAARSSLGETVLHKPEARLASELRSVATPVALSGLTTTIGFAATSLAGTEAVRNVGAFGGVGVLATTALVLSALPAALTIRPRSTRPPRGFVRISERLASILARHCSRRRSVVIGGWLLATLVSAIGISRVELDTDATRWFRPGTTTRDDYEAIKARLSGISPINVVIESSHQPNGAQTSLLNTQTIDRVWKLTEYLGSLESVGKAVSIADPIIQTHSRFAESSLLLPDSSNALEQYLLLLESADHIRDLITSDRTAANIVVRLDNNGSAGIVSTARTAEEWWAENGTPGTTARSTGVMYEFARAQDAIARGQIVGLSSAVAAIALILLATFGSLKAAAVTIAPNIAPIIGIYGAMGFLDVPVDAGTVLVGNLALGIAVDDTVHVASTFFDATKVRDDREAVREALKKTLPAICYTTLVVGAGFSILALSEFTFVRNLGVLMAAAMAACLVADAHLLPSLLASRRRHSPVGR